MNLTFNEENHEYRIDGVVVPSVSELLSPLTAEGYDRIAPETLRIAAERGTEVHEACEALDYGLDPDDDLSPDVFGYLDAYTQFLTDCEVEWLGIEDMGCCTAYPVDYAGTVDRWGYVNDQLCVVDIKTYASPSIEQKCAVAIQTIAYEGILSERNPELTEGFKHYALFLKKDGRYTLFDLDDFAEKEGLKRVTIFGTLCDIYAQKQAVKRRIEEIKDKHRRKRVAAED